VTLLGSQGLLNGRIEQTRAERSLDQRASRILYDRLALLSVRQEYDDSQELGCFNYHGLVATTSKL